MHVVFEALFSPRFRFRALIEEEHVRFLNNLEGIMAAYQRTALGSIDVVFGTNSLDSPLSRPVSHRSFLMNSSCLAYRTSKPYLELVRAIRQSTSIMDLEAHLIVDWAWVRLGIQGLKPDSLLALSFLVDLYMVIRNPSLVQQSRYAKFTHLLKHPRLAVLAFYNPGAMNRCLTPSHMSDPTCPSHLSSLTTLLDVNAFKHSIYAVPLGNIPSIDDFLHFSAASETCLIIISPRDFLKNDDAAIYFSTNLRSMLWHSWALFFLLVAFLQATRLAYLFKNN